MTPIIDPADRMDLARAFIASNGTVPSPAESAAAARHADAVARMNPEERAQAFRQFLDAVASLPGGPLLLTYTRCVH